MTHLLSPAQPKMVRSHSTSRNQLADDNAGPRRKSIAHAGERKPTESNPTKERRSSIRFDCLPNPSESPKGRSKSLKSPKQTRRSGILHSTSGSNIDQHKEKGLSRSLTYSLSVPGDDSDLHRLRNFVITSKGIVNRGDSFRNKGTSRSVLQKMAAATGDILLQVPEATTSAEETTNGASCTISDTTRTSSSSSIRDKCSSKFRVWIMGLAGVGKTSLKLQFMTSENECQFDNAREEMLEKNVTIILDGEEFELEITECSGSDEKELFNRPMPDAFLMVYSVTNRRSYIHTKELLSYIEPTCDSKAVILVGNKTDLARLRTVSTLEGRSLAKEWGSKFIETSVAINHQVDELLVGIITQIKIRSKGKKQDSFLTRSRSNKATGIIKRLWRKTCMPNTSCDNLHTV